MTFKVFKASSLRLSDELLFHFLVTDDKRHIHQRAILRTDSALEHLALIEEIVKDLCLLFVVCLHAFEAAHLLDPLEHLTADVDAVARRRIVKGTVVSLDLPVAHSRSLLERRTVSDQILTDNNNLHACRADILLNAAIDNTILRHINRLREEAGRNIGDKDVALCVRQFLILCSINRIVFADIHIVCILRNIQIGAVRNIGEGLVRRRCNLNDFAVLFSFLSSLLCPLAGDDVCSLAVSHQVHRNLCENQRCAALQENDFIIVRNVHQFTKICFCFVNDLLEHLGAVAHFHHAHTAAAVIHHFLCCFFQNFFRKNSRTSTEIINSAHGKTPPYS